MSDLNLSTATFKDFENNTGKGPNERAELFSRYVADWKSRGHWNYRLESVSGSGPELELALPGSKLKTVVSLVSSDYLGFSRHPAVVQAAIEGLLKYGSSTGASPAIGGHYTYHREIEERTAAFFSRESAMLFTSGYTANSATIQALLRSDDLAILDMAVHASMYEGCQLTNLRTFPHNHLGKLERILAETAGRYRTRMIIVDGIYSQPADMAPLKDIVQLARKYGAMVAVDDAHGVGVIGERGRGVVEHFGLAEEIDLITGTFSKALGHIGGYVVANRALINYLKFQARQHIFSVTMTPAACAVLKSLDLIDQEPWWKEKLWDNIVYFKTGLDTLGLDTGNSCSAIIPVITGSPALAAEACRLLLEAGVYATQIGYPAVARRNARVRMSVTATHTREHLNHVLNAWEWTANKLNMKRKELCPPQGKSIS
jgi:glycine C-acetyltransferase